MDNLPMGTRRIFTGNWSDNDDGYSAPFGLHSHGIMMNIPANNREIQVYVSNFVNVSKGRGIIFREKWGDIWGDWYLISYQSTVANINEIIKQIDNGNNEMQFN